MRLIAFALIYICFFALVFGVAYITKSEWALLALLLIPSASIKSDNKHENKD